jgi:hypothetical protein
MLNQSEAEAPGPEGDPVLADDGYPGDRELERIRCWPMEDWPGLMAYVRARWRYADDGYWERRGDAWLLHTAGWSGNESLVQALSENMLFWSACWVWSCRGGHYGLVLPSWAEPEADASGDRQVEDRQPDAVLLEHLERDYSKPEIPACRVCGGPLAIGAIGGGEPTRYYCAAMSDAPGNGLPKDWDHYGASLWLDRRAGGDERVLELARRYREALELPRFVSPLNAL